MRRREERWRDKCVQGMQVRNQRQSTRISLTPQSGAVLAVASRSDASRSPTYTTVWPPL